MAWGYASMPARADVPANLPELPLLDSFQPDGVMIKGVTVRGEMAYVVAAYGGFFVIDLSDPDRIQLVGKCDTPGNATEVAVAGDYAYTADRPTGIQIIDVSDPSEPHIVGVYDSVERATGLDVAGNVLAICNRTLGVEFADLSDPIRPRHLSALRLGEAQGVRIRGDVAYVGLWHNRKLAAVDISDLRDPNVLGEAALGGYGWGLAIVDDLIYAATGHHSPGADGKNRGHGMDVVDVSDPRNPRSVNRIDTPPFYRLGNDWWWTAASGDHVFHADGENGVYVYDITDRRSPVPVARALAADFSGAVAAFDDRLLVADMKGGLRLFAAGGLAVSAALAPVAAREIPPAKAGPTGGPGYRILPTSGQARSVAIAGNHAIVACGMGGLDVFDLAPAIQRVATVPTPGVAFDVEVRDERAYVALGSGGTAVYDVSDPLNPKLLGRVEGRAAHHLEVVGETLCALRGGGSVDLIDVSDSAAPALVASSSIPHFPDQLTALSASHMLGVSPWQIALFGLSRPADVVKRVLSEHDRDGALGIMAHGSRVMVCRESALELWTAEDIDDIHMVSSVDLPSWRGGLVAWDGTRAVISSRARGVVSFAETDDAFGARVLATVSLPGYPARSVVIGDLALIPCGYAGLAVIRWDDIDDLVP